MDAGQIVTLLQHEIKADGDFDGAASALSNLLFHSDRLTLAEDRRFVFGNRNAAGAVRWFALAEVGERIGKPHLEPRKTFWIHPAKKTNSPIKVAAIDAKKPGPKQLLSETVFRNVVLGVLRHHFEQDLPQLTQARVIHGLREMLRAEIKSRLKRNEKSLLDRYMPERSLEAIRSDLKRDDKWAVAPIDFTIATCTDSPIL